MLVINALYLDCNDDNFRNQLQTPQIILLTFDGAVNLNNFDHYKRVFTESQTNPNGCPIRGTFFISHEYCDYNMVQYLAHEGHEIGVETIS